MSPTSPIHEFSAPVARFSQLIGVNLGTVVRKIAGELLNKIIFRTPVDTGRARSSWDLSLDQPSNYLPPEGDGPFPANPNVGPGQLASIDGTRHVWITSNLDYIEALEHGHSQQAPVGMVVVSVAEVEAEITALVAKLDQNA